MAKIRLDQLLVQQGLAPNRMRAQALILAGKVWMEDVLVDKPGRQVPDSTAVTVRGAEHPYVSRGGVKLAGALDVFGVSVEGLRCLDLGASTGGFTDCLLQRGAQWVVAVDVGYGQLAHKLRTDERVLNLERTNARTLVPGILGGPCDLTVIDASFIGLAKLMEATARCTRAGGELIALVKPQFEAGRTAVSRGRGVIRDPEVRTHAIQAAIASVEEHGFLVLAMADSCLAGPKGNVEAFIRAQRLPSEAC